MIPYGTQSITEEDISAVVETLRSSYLTQGPKVTQFETALAEYCGAKYAACTNSATSALHISCLALGLTQGDWLWTSPNSFVASANCGLYCGAKVDFVDIEPTHLNICPDKLEQKLIAAERNGCLPKVIVVVHFAGQPCEMKTIAKLAKQYNFKVIEDASHAIGSSYNNNKTGNGHYSDITVFSFHPVKIITSAEGGCALTNCSKIDNKLKSLRSHGITRDLDLMKSDPEGNWVYEQQELGFNYRMTDLQAALGLSQLSRLDDYITQRHHLANVYDERLKELPVKLPARSTDSYSALHLYPIQLDLDSISLSRAQVFNVLREHDVGVNVHYIPIHLQPFYKKLGFTAGDFPNAEKYYSRALTIPLHPKLQQSDIDYIIYTLKRSLT
ncbi:UDP-4-amino-4,6-dideoxy-N-acetyl-beta-L-altrosamine transaminase [Neptuniibacter sp. QD37_6]|uniref:UDP-4-amino-4, 6-dideoxy-N-acetyl-beta-L-altrosamine transaminase n=1 Tax=Neptuniibacter sp. QD37_6 TaxID=3398210 RepID=UPI0039F6398D